MAQSLIMCFLLVESLMGLALASEKVQTLVQPNSDLPSETLATSGLAFKLVRKLGNHMEQSVSLVAPPIHGLSIAPSSQQEHEGVHGGDGSSTGSRENASSHEMDIAPGQQQEVHQEHHHHHSMDKSVAGGGVILGGLATTFLVAIFCYIRATGRDKPDTISKV
ncbi:hypothetical protein LINGRAHAP2_LOCUS35360 [Linum grandiflorum]